MKREESWEEGEGEKLGNISFFWEISLAIIFVVLRVSRNSRM